MATYNFTSGKLPPGGVTGDKFVMNGANYTYSNGAWRAAANPTFVTSTDIVDGSISAADLAETYLKTSGGTLTGDLNLGDAKYINLGDSSDLQIYHQGGSSHIRNASGDLYIEDNDGQIYIRGKTGEDSIRVNAGGSVQLYNAGSLKLSTTSTGIDVTGSIKSSRLTHTRDPNNVFIDFVDSTAANDTNGDILVQGYFPIIFKTDMAHERMRITRTGNVGIRTTNPQATLDIQNGNGFALVVGADVNATTLSANTRKYVRIGYPHYSTAGSAPTTACTLIVGDSQSGENGVHIGGYTSYGVAASQIKLYTQNGTGQHAGIERLIINSTGTVQVPGNIVCNDHIQISSGSAWLEIKDSTSGTSTSVANVQFSHYQGTLGRVGWIDDSTNDLHLENQVAGGIKLSANGSPRMYIKSDGNVGIGTTSLYSGTNVTSLTIKGVSYPSIALKYGAGDTLSGIIAADSNGISLSSSGSRSIEFFTNSEERMNIDSTGNVGIGTSSPDATLETTNNTTAYSAHFGSTLNATGDNVLALTCYDENTSNTSYLIRAQSNTAGINEGTYHDRFCVLSKGNVGIGTSSPSERLDIEDNTTAALSLNSTSGRDWRLSSNTTGDFRITDNALGERLRINHIGNVGIGTSSPDVKLHIEKSSDPTIRVRQTTNGVNLDLTCDSGAGFLKTQTNHPLILATNNTERMRIDSAGNVGIGTSSPEYLLDVERTTGNLVRFITKDDNNGATNPLSISYNAALRIDNKYSGASPSANGTKVAKIQLSTVTSSGYGAYGAIILDAQSGTGYNAGEMSFATGPNSSSLMTERMRITSSGNVELSNRLKLKSTTNGSMLQFYENTSTYSGSVETYNSGGMTLSTYIAGSDIIFRPDTGTEAMRISSTGKVGIGTDTPTSLLTVNHSSAGVNLFELKYNNTARMTIDVDGTWNNIRGQSGQGFKFTTTGGALMVVGNGGNVGIGTTSPSAKLDIKGNFESSYALKFTNTMGTGKVSGFRSHGTNGESLSLYNDGRRMQMWQSDGTHIFESTSGSERMRITPTGSIGTGDWSGQFHQIRNVNNWHYASGGSYGPTYIHMKTNRSPTSESQMYSVTFRGHSYGQSKPINTSLCWYNYASQGNVISVGSNGTHTAGCYKSSDGYAVMTLYIPSHYYVAFTFDQFITNQRLRELTITNVIIHFGATGAY